MKKILKETNQKGITLVALVITIIILLILAGISIQAITNTGLFAQAENAKRESEIASVKEQIALDIYEKQLVPPLGSITEEQLETILGKYGTVNKEDGKIVGITTDKGYEILLSEIYSGGTTVGTETESVPDGAVVMPINDITTWLKTGGISKQYSYTTIDQVIADSTCTKSLMNNENAMKYLARSTEFADAICASETTMTSLGKSAYVDDTVLNSDRWIDKISNSIYFEKVLSDLVPAISNSYSCSDGTIIYSTESPLDNSRYSAWKAFDKDNSTWFATVEKSDNCFIGFNFINPVHVYSVYCYGHNFGKFKYKLQYSDDGVTYYDTNLVDATLVIDSSDKTKYTSSHNGYHKYYRIYKTADLSTYKSTPIITLSFYGKRK